MQTVQPETTTPSRSPLRRLPSWVRWTLLGILAVIVLLGAALVVLRLLRPGVLPDTTVAGVEVGGMTRAELETAVGDLAADRAGAPLTVTLDDTSVTGVAEDVGYAFDVESTVDRVWRRGRQANPFLALGDQIRAFWEPTNLSPVRTVDDAGLTAWVEDASDELDREPVEGQVTFSGAEVQRSDPVEGARVSRQQLANAIRVAVLEPGADEIAAPHEVLTPVSTVEAVAGIAERAERVVSAPVVLARGDAELVFEPAELGDLFTVSSDFSGDAAAYGLTASAEDVAAFVSDEQIAALEAEPVDATFSLTSDGMEIEPATEGFRFDAEAATGQLIDVAEAEPGEDGVRRAELAGEILEPDRTTEEAEALEIVEPVASFTTNHACCQTRVQNIQRFADIVDGTVVEPGQVISLNEVVGERTRAKGFTGGGAIYRGEYVEQVGGGVSQFATTFFNAAYFGGYEIVEHKPHSYYISRYPPGRESTINWPNVDVKVRNDSPYGMYVDTSYTGTSITVTIWGREWVDVTSVTGERYRYRDPETEIEINEDLPEGAEEVVQAGSQGFDINVTRTLTFPDGETEERTFFTRYLPEPRIIERNPADS